MARGSIALLLSIAFAGAPLVAVHCEVACATEQTIANATFTSGTPGTPGVHAAHHHSSGPAAPAATSSIGQGPERCGLNHQSIAASADTVRARTLTPTDGSLEASLPASSSIRAVTILAWDFLGSSAPPGSTVRSLASPLRI